MGGCPGHVWVEAAEVLGGVEVEVEDVVGVVSKAGGEGDGGHELSTRGDVDSDVATIVVDGFDGVSDVGADSIEFDFTFERGQVDLGFLAVVGGDDGGGEVEGSVDLVGDAGVFDEVEFVGDEPLIAGGVEGVHHRLDVCAGGGDPRCRHTILFRWVRLETMARVYRLEKPGANLREPGLLKDFQSESIGRGSYRSTRSTKMRVHQVISTSST